jgi:hypothetical protein
MKKNFFELDEDKFNEKIRQIEDYLDSDPGGIMSKNLEGFKNIIQFVKELNTLVDLNQFFDSNEGKFATKKINQKKNFPKIKWL